MDKKLIAFAALIAVSLSVQMVMADTITTPSRRTICNNGICTSTLYGGVRFVEESGKWINIEDSTVSLMPYFKLKVIEQDKNYNVTLKSLTYDSIEFEITTSSDVKSTIPIESFVEKMEKVTGNIIKDDIKKLDVTKASAKQTVVISKSMIGKSPIDSNYKFGANSTVVTLTNPNTQLLDDSAIDASDVNNNRGAEDAFYVQMGSGSQFSSLVKFNISNMSSTTVTNATFCGYIRELSTLAIDIYHIFDNQTWNEETITFAGFKIPISQMNLTSQSQRSPGSVNAYYCWDVTNGVKRDATAGKVNTSFYLNSTQTGTTKYAYFNSKEYATNRPYMNVTYTETPPAFVDWINVKISSPANATVTGWYNISLMVNGSNSSSNVSLFVRGGNITGQQGIYNDSKPFWITFNKTTLDIPFYQANGAFNITALAFNGTNTDTDTVFYTQALPSPQITVYTPANSSYTDSYVILNVSVSAYTGNISNPWIFWAKDGIWNRSYNLFNPLHSGAADDCDSVCRRSSVYVNVPVNGGAHNITIASRDYGTYATNWTVIYFSILTYSNITYGTLPTFINETRPLSLSVDYVYNPNLITNITTKFYVDSQSFDMANSKNATNVLNTYSYNVPLVALNDTQKDLIYETTIRYANGSLEYFNSSTYNYNVTYIAFLSSVDTGSAQYLEGAPIDSILYAYNYTNAVTMSVWMDLTYNASRNLTYALSSFSGTTLRAYEYDFPAHTPTANLENVTLTGTAVITYGSASRTMTTTASANIYKFNITNCSEGTPSLIVTFFNETNFTATTGYLPIVYISATSGTITREYSFFNLTENDTFQFCMSPSWANPTADIYVSYSKAGAPVREYYANNVTLTSTPSYINAYILGTAEAYYTNIYVYDGNGARYPNAYVKVLKMNPATAVYTTMFIGKTDSEGIMPTYLYPLTQPYKFFILDSENNLLYQTQAESIPCLSSCPPYEKHIYMETTLTGQIDFGGITSVFSYDNTTRAMSISISDDEGLAENIMVSIWALSDFGGRALYYNSTTNSSAISYSTVLSDANSEYLLVVNVMENGEYYPYRQESMVITRNQPFGVVGGMMAIFIVLGFSAFGFVVFEHIGGLVGCGLGIVLCSQYVLRLLPIDAIGISGLLVVLAIIAYAVSRD